MAEGIVALYHRTDQLKAAIDDLAKFVQDSIEKVEMELAIDELAIMVGETVNEMERNVRAARCGSYNCGPVLSHQLIFFKKKTDRSPCSLSRRWSTWTPSDML